MLNTICSFLWACASWICGRDYRNIPSVIVTLLTGVVIGAVYHMGIADMSGAMVSAIRQGLEVASSSDVSGQVLRATFLTAFMIPLSVVGLASRLEFCVPPTPREVVSLMFGQRQMQTC